MNSLPFPDYDCDEFADDMLAHLSLQDHSLTPRVEAIIRESYASYVANMSGMGDYASPSLDADDADQLRRGFDVLRDTKKFAQARLALANSVKTIGELCPICGTSPAWTLDHFAPQRGVIPFPEQSFHIRNLVPMCEKCNRHKSSISADHPRDIQFPHLYYDSRLIDSTHLIATVVTGGHYPYVEFAFRYDADISPWWIQLVEDACVRLNLFDRWSSLGQEEMAAVALEYTEAPFAWSVVDISKSLTTRAGAYRAKFGRNNFRSAVFDAVAGAPEFWQGPHSILIGS